MHGKSKERQVRQSHFSPLHGHDSVTRGHRHSPTSSRPTLSLPTPTRPHATHGYSDASPLTITIIIIIITITINTLLYK